MKKLLLCILFLGIYSVSAQTSLDKYKYIIIPKKFADFKKENQYQTSTMVKHLFVKEGFIAVYDDALPNELSSNRCLGLLLDLDDQSSMFSTKTTLRLKDCNAKEVFTTKQGRSKIKEYKSAFSAAIKDAFGSVEALNYKYSSVDQEMPITVSFKNDIKQLEEKESLKAKNSQNAAIVTQEATLERQTYKSNIPQTSNFKKAGNEMANVGELQNVGTLYAQETESGYQLIDSTPKIQMKLFKTSEKGVYLAEKESIHGILLNKGGQWFFEYYEGAVLKSKMLTIKF